MPETAEEVVKKELARIDKEGKDKIAGVELKLNEAIEKKAGVTEFEALKAEYDATKTEVETLKTALEEQGMKLKAAEEQASGRDPKEMALKALDSALDKNKAAIKVAASGGAPVRINVLKDAGVMGTANFGDGVIRGLRLAGIDDLDRKPYWIMEHISVIHGGEGSNPFSVVEKFNKQGGAAPVAENALKPFMSFEYKQVSANAEVIAAIVPVNKQALWNMPQLRGHIMVELMAELEEVLQYQIIHGDGLEPNIKGIKQYATAFNPGGMAGKVDTPNTQDALRAIIAQVHRAYGRANVIALHPDQIALMDLTKGEDGHYSLPPFISADGMAISGAKIKEAFDIEFDEFIAGDFKRYMFNIVKDIEFEVGLINDQFQRNQLSVKGELYGAGLVKSQHTNKLVKGSITDVKALIAAA